jgi:hypothetical protein
MLKVLKRHFSKTTVGAVASMGQFASHSTYVEQNRGLWACCASTCMPLEAREE